MVHGKKIPRRRVPGKTGPGKMVPVKLVPGKISPGKMFPGKLVPGKMVPRKMVPGPLYVTLRYACQAWLACEACMVYVHMWRVCVAYCVMWVQFVSGLRVWVRTCGVCVSGVQECVCVPSLSLPSIPLQPLNPHAPPPRPHWHNLFSRTFRTSRGYGDYGYLKIKRLADTWSAISRLPIVEIKKI